MFTTYTQVRMHDTDMVGILFFASQFRFVHDALEDFVAHIGFALPQLLPERSFVFVVRHVEADYLAPLALGDKLRIEVSIVAMGTSSFTVAYSLWRGEELVGTATTVHVTLDHKTRQKIPLPPAFKAALEPYLKLS